MNNEIKQILKNQLALLDVEGLIYDKEKRTKETIDLLNPKEDVPYEGSLGDGLSKCCKAPILIKGDLCTKCGKPVKFAKSSKGKRK